MELGLDGDWALITGSSRGIGKSIAKAFLEEQARVVLTGRNEDDLRATVDELAARYGSENIFSVAGDLAVAENMTRLTDAVVAGPGRLDYLICNIGSGSSVPPLEEDVVEFQRMLDINLLSAVAAVSSLRPLLENASSERGAASITFIGSICGEEALGCPVAYAAAKSGLEAYAKNLSRPLGKKGIRVNVVSPGNVVFPGSTWERKRNDNAAEVETMLAREVPLQRLGEVDEIASVVVFLASKRAAFVHGANWVVDGGQLRS